MSQEIDTCVPELLLIALRYDKAPFLVNSLEIVPGFLGLDRKQRSIFTFLSYGLGL
jgi:hypothetical protein